MTDPGPWNHPLLATAPGRTRQVSSHNQDERGNDWLGSRPLAARRKRILLEPGETHVMADLRHPGLITRIWMTTLLPLRWHALVDAVLRFSWDGEAEPSVETSLGDFFGAPFGGYRSYQSAVLSITGGGLNCLFPMPFASKAELSVTNESGRRLDPIYYSITYYELDEPPPTGLRFHAKWNRQNPTEVGRPYQVLQLDHASGHYVGARLDMQCRHRWLGRPLSDIVFPNGLGFGMMEGMEHIFIDGEPEPSIVGTGTEDYFNAGWYYAPGKFSAPTHGCTVRDWIRGRVSAYRFDITAPTRFDDSIHVTIDHGIDNLMVTDYTSVAYWYQREPHQPFPSLPAPADRRYDTWYGNALQATAVATPVAALGLAGIRSVAGRFGGRSAGRRRWPR